MMIQMKCMTEDRIQRLQGYIKTYMGYCSHVSTQYNKNFDFLKQHLTTHIIPESQISSRREHSITMRLVLAKVSIERCRRHTNKQTNCKEAEPQIARIDENLEAVALMFIDNHDASQHESTLAKTTRSDEVQSGSDATQIRGTLTRSDEHWILGSPVSGITDVKGLVDELVPSWTRMINLVDHEVLQRYRQLKKKDEGYSDIHTQKLMGNTSGITRSRHLSSSIHFESTSHTTDGICLK
ncbi:uncharacterized protein EDB93DRAFT_712962 [Suillus bovinus]|uniref:uncharacterized protein n=1 Tax=Suillus bovinus TaxID=48563 RepID=UPI001B88263A|nr:uncharacterized protein EDB93DRAFT_712962 [Suillus bovinus]KAG2138696.1 hypothetical protein EDB93DRAFT_712962 [Suillus bovinus]